MNPRKERPTNERCEPSEISSRLNSMDVHRVHLAQAVQKSVFPDQADAWSLPTPTPHPDGEARQVQCPAKENKATVLSSGQSLSCGNGSPVLLDLLTFQEKMEIWNFIQVFQLLNIISNLKREKSKPNKTHRTVGWTQCMGCQCAVPALFDTRGAESHTALAYFTFHLAGCDFLSSLQTRLPLTQFWLGGPPLPGVS